MASRDHSDTGSAARLAAFSTAFRSASVSLRVRTAALASPFGFGGLPGFPCVFFSMIGAIPRESTYRIRKLLAGP